MKFTIGVITIIIISFVSGLYFPWWVIAITSCLVCALIPQRAIISFLCGFCAIFLLWGTLAYWISSSNDHILAHKISILILKTDNPVLLILTTAIVGGLVAGIASITGSFLRTLLLGDPKDSIIADF